MNLPHKITETLPDGITFTLLLVEGGEFEMGNAGEDAYGAEKPIHTVQVQTFYMAKFLVTQAFWKALMKSGNPSRFKGDTRPVEWVSWNEIRKFIKALNNAASRVYRLPSEAEWEYAARGGKHSEDYLYAGSDKLSEVGWYNKNSGSETQDVGQLLPNELGIYDLSGNVWEWCEDDYHKNYEGAPSDGAAWVDRPQRGVHRVIRGGSWVYDAQHCRISSRHNRSPGGRHDGGIGFRLALSPSQLLGH